MFFQTCSGPATFKLTESRFSQIHSSIITDQSPNSPFFLKSHLAQKCILKNLCFRALHSTESALLRKTNDLLLAADSGNCSVLLFLDLTAAFDTVDHSILIHRLNQWAGVLWFYFKLVSSYLSNRSLNVTISNSSSSSAPISCGVPQGSIPGPILFALYIRPLWSVF